MPLVVIPAKPLARAKERLSVVLTPQERRDLSLAMLADVCAAAAGVGEVLVVASDTDAEAVARISGARVLRDPSPAAGLNPSLEAAIPQSPDGVLVLASDVPACSGEDLTQMMDGPGVRLAPDAAGTGTNALWRLPGDVIPLSFGEGSAARHESLAGAQGIPYATVHRSGLALDLDLPEHLGQAWEAAIGIHTREALAAMGFPERLAPLGRGL